MVKDLRSHLKQKKMIEKINMTEFSSMFENILVTVFSNISKHSQRNEGNARKVVRKTMYYHKIDVLRKQMKTTICD